MSKRIPTLAFLIEGSFAVSELRAEVERALIAGIERVARSLGIRATIGVKFGEATGEGRFSIDGARVYISQADAVRAQMCAFRRLLSASEADHGVLALDARDLDPAVRARWIASMVEAALITRPALLLTRTVTSNLAAHLNARLETGFHWTVLAPLIESSISEGLSVEALSESPTFRDDLAVAGRYAVREALSGRPRTIVLSLHQRDLQRMLALDTAGDAHPLAEVHERARAGLGLPLPSIQIEVGTNDEGMYQLRVNNVRELEQPLLPAAHSLRFESGGNAFIPALRTVAHNDPSTTGYSPLSYLALDVFNLISRRGSRLIERSQVQTWCAAIGKPSLLALAMTAEHFDDLPDILRSLLADRISIRDLVTILERIIDHHTIETPAPHSHIVISQAFPVIANLPPKESRITESVRLGLTEAIQTRLGAEPVRIVPLTEELELAISADPSLARRQELLDAFARFDAHNCDAIVTTIELRSLVAKICAEAQTDVAVVSYHELSPTLQVTRTGPIRMPPGIQAGAGSSPAIPIRRPAANAPAPTPATGFGLLLADLESRRPALDQLVTDLVPPLSSPDAPGASSAMAYDPIAKPDSLPDQGWGVIVPRSDMGAVMLEALGDLIEHRSERQRARFSVFRVSVEESLRPHEWIRKSFESLPQWKRPRYVLIVGDFAHIGLELQLALAPLAAVGRLPFDTAAELKVYASKVIAAENAAPSGIRPCLFSAGDESAATQIARTHLVLPCQERIERDSKVRAQPVRMIDGGKDDLLRVAGEHNFLLTATHGIGTRMSYDERRKLQGSLLTATDELLTADDVTDRPFVTNGFWFLFACYGLGTPSVSSYGPWIDELYRSETLKEKTRDMIRSGLLAESEQPFAAAVPKRALANPRGPLAVIGHVDLAWSYGFMQDNQSRSDRMYAAMRVVLRGQLVGLGIEQITQTHSFVSDQLNESYAQMARGEGHLPMVGKRELSRLWMLRQDLRNFVLFGDPAARITHGGGT